MALATRCPECSALFRVGAEQLKSRGGMVRCGSCRHVFNAIACLDYVESGAAGEEMLAASRGAASNPPEPVRSAAPTAVRESAQGLVQDPGPATLPGFVPAPVPAQSPAASVVPDAPRRPAVPPPTLPAQSGVADSARLAALPGRVPDPPAVEPLPEAMAPGAPEREQMPRLFDDAPVEFSLQDPEVLAQGLPEPDFLRASQPRPRPALQVALQVACGLLVPVVLAELALLMRADILVALPEARPALAALCAPLGCSAQWPMLPEQLAVVSSELQAVPGTSAYEFSLQVRNRADFPLAVPAIELTLTDSGNHPVARRVFLPAEFLGATPDVPAPAPDALGPGADLAVRLLFEMPGVQAAGFVAYPFYP